MSTERTPSATFSEPEAQRILARAAEIEGAGGTRFTIDELRQIALKAGIEQSALEHAIAEVRSVDATSSSTPAAVSSPQTIATLSRRTALTLAASGAALGVLAMIADRLQVGNASELAVLAPSALFAIYHGMRHPVRQGLGSLVRNMAVVFGSFTLAVIGIGGMESMSDATGWSLVCGALASGAFALRTNATPEGAEVVPADPR